MRLICSKCRKYSRYNLKNKNPWQCKKCGSFEYKINKEKVCYCDGYWFPHKLKSGCCIHNPNREKYYDGQSRLRLK